MNREEIKARWDAATRGPWEADVDEQAVATAMELVMICHPYDTARPETAADMQAIAHAPTDVRALLDELEAQDRLIEQLGTALAGVIAETGWYEAEAPKEYAALAALSTWKDAALATPTTGEDR